MISVQEATRIILDHKIHLANTFVPLEKAMGHILREDLTADRDFPPYDRVTMDGIAIQYSAFTAGQRSFPIEAIAAAGAAQVKMQDSSHCIEVMTGAILPAATDTVIRYEDLHIENGQANITIDALKAGQNVHRQGTDRTKGAVVIKAGHRIASPEIGVAATIGKGRLRVAAPPRTIIVSTGDELVEIDKIPLPHQIRKSNVHRIKATLKSWGIEADTAHLIDNEAAIKEKLQDYLDTYQVILLSGGVSKGKFDFIPKALDDLKVRKLFHRIAQRPGKPFWFGQYHNGACVFALPGNPVSSFMCTMRYFHPWLLASLEQEPLNYPFAILAKDFEFVPDLTYFLQVKLNYNRDGNLSAYPIAGHGSGDLANLVDTDGFLELPRGRNVFKKGEVFPFFPFR